MKELFKSQERQLGLLGKFSNRLVSIRRSPIITKEVCIGYYNASSPLNMRTQTCEFTHDASLVSFLPRTDSAQLNPDSEARRERSCLHSQKAPRGTFIWRTLRARGPSTHKSLSSPRTWTKRTSPGSGVELIIEKETLPVGTQNRILRRTFLAIRA